MEIEELLKKAYKEWKPSVNEQEWKHISQDARVVRHNRLRRWRKVWIGNGIGLVTVAVITTALILNHPSQMATYQSDKQNNRKENTTHIKAERSGEKKAVTTAERPLTVKADCQESVPASTSIIAEERAMTVATTTPTTPLNPQSNNNTETAAPQKITTKTATETKAPSTALRPTEPTKVTTTKETTSQVTPNQNETNEQPAQDTQLALRLFVPSAFTPNGDGLNDLFYVTANFEPASFEMTIFTRSNEKVFHTRSMEIGWDGTRYGSTLPQGVYLYLIKYTNADGFQEAQRGQILLLK